MRYTLTPASLGNNLGVELDEALLATAQHALGWKCRTSSATSSYPHISLCPKATGLPTTEQAAQLRENEYIACRRGKDTLLFLADGYVRFNGQSSTTQVGVYPRGSQSQSQTRPVIALETALFRALLIQETLLFHALVFDYQGQGFLVLGESGAGKTTLALAAMAAGAKVVSDDRIALRSEGRELIGRSMRPFLQIRSDTLKHINRGTLGGMLAMADVDVPVMRMDRAAAPDSFADHTKITRILILHSGADQRPEISELKPADKAECLAAAMSSSLPYMFTLPREDLGAEPTALCLQLLRLDHIAHLTTGSNLMLDPVNVFMEIMASQVA